MMESAKKPIFYTEAAYALGMILLAFATALMTVADFGLSMVAAPAYLLHLKLVEYFPFFSFGMASYSFQALLLIAMMIVVRRFRVSYLFSFVTGVLYGFLLDGSLFLVELIPASHIAMRILLYALGVLFCSVAVSLMFRTYISPAVYELFVKEIAEKFGFVTSRFKSWYDCVSCLLSIVLSFSFFGFPNFVGIHVGTVICALVNGLLIGMFGRWFDKHFTFSDAFGARRLFQK